MTLVREQDHDRYLTALYAPADARPALFALFAFNVELARIREHVSEPMIGEIRLAWWREAVEGAYAGAPRAHPVVEALARFVVPRQVPADLLIACIDARLSDIYGEQPATLDDLVAYADNSGGALAQAVLHALAGPTGAPSSAQSAAVRAIGRAWALTGIVRAIGFHAALQRVMLPADLLAAAGIETDSLFKGEIGAGVEGVVRQVHARAMADLDVAGPVVRGLSGTTRAAALLAPLARDYLGRIAAAGFDMSAARLERGVLTRQGKLLWSALTGRC